MSLTGPSRTIIVQPVEVPERAPEPNEAPAPEPQPEPERETEPEKVEAAVGA